MITQVGYAEARKALGEFRFRVRLVAMLFLDSVMYGMLAFASGLMMLTLVEFIASALSDMPLAKRRWSNLARADGARYGGH